MPHEDTKTRVLKKLELLAKFQKMTQILDKEGDKMSEFAKKEKEKGEIAEIKEKLKK